MEWFLLDGIVVREVKFVHEWLNAQARESFYVQVRDGDAARNAPVISADQ
jgi:hypothetical protein